MRVAVLGAGALGSLYGAWSADAGHDVVLVARRPHADAIRDGGLAVRAIDGTSRVVELDATDDPSAAVGADVVLVACKAQDTAHLLARVGAAAPAAVWSVQNGARQSEPLATRFGAAAIGCVSMVGATLDAPGRVSHTFTGATYLGPLAGSSAGAIDAVVSSLGGICVERRDDIVDVLWSKAVLAAGAMGVSLLARLPYHHVFVEAPARRVFYELVAEAAGVATAAGATLVDLPGPLQAGTLMTMPRAEALDALAGIGAAMVERGQTSTRVSMLQSVESGRRLEVDAVFGDLVDVADRYGLTVPLLRAVADIARTLDDLAARGDAAPPIENRSDR